MVKTLESWHDARSHTDRTPPWGEIFRSDMKMDLSKIYGPKNRSAFLMVELSPRRGQTLAAAAGGRCHGLCARGRPRSAHAPARPP